MSSLEEPFRLSPEPGFKDVTTHNAMGGNSYCVRFEGNEILALARFCYMREDKQPILSIKCERGDNFGPVEYLGFRVLGLTLSEQGVSIQFYDPTYNPRDYLTSFSLKLLSNQKTDPSGEVISYVDIRPTSFPRAEYLAFREEQVRKQIDLPRSVKAGTAPAV